MARSLEQKHKAQHSTSRYLILREALEIEATGTDDLEKILPHQALMKNIENNLSKKF